MTQSINTETGFATINGTKIFYTNSNPQNEETLVMVHAGICDHRMWDRQVAHFAEKYQVISFDMYGFGQSGTPDSEFAFHTDIIALLDHLKVDSAWFMACSLGGAITLDVALMHPDKVKGLVLVASAIAGYKYEGERHPLAAKIDEADERGDLEAINEFEIQMWVDGKGRKPEDLDPAMRQLALDMNLIALKTDDDFWDNEIEIDPPALERLSEINMPTLLIYGDLDVPASIERIDILEKEISGAKKVLMPGTAHLPNMERPVEFNQIVDDFLSELSR